MLLERVRNALRIKNHAHDDELVGYIAAAVLDLGVAGVEFEEMDELVITAIITYCKMRNGLPEDYDKLKKSYDEQKAQMSNASGYTNWEVDIHV